MRPHEECKFWIRKDANLQKLLSKPAWASQDKGFSTGQLVQMLYDEPLDDVEQLVSFPGSPTWQCVIGPRNSNQASIALESSSDNESGSRRIIDSQNMPSNQNRANSGKSPGQNLGSTLLTKQPLQPSIESP